MVRCDYSAAELSVEPGDELVLHKPESGWHWASKSDGEVGWIPAEKVDVLDGGGGAETDDVG